MRKALLDTDILSEFLKGRDRTVVHRAAVYAASHGAFTFTSVTVHEILFGLRCKNASAQLHNTVKWLRQNEEITPIADDYYEAARFRAEARQQGSALQLADS